MIVYSAVINSRIIDRIESVVKKPKEKEFLIDILEYELYYADQQNPHIRKELKILIEQRFPFKSTQDETN